MSACTAPPTCRCASSPRSGVHRFVQSATCPIRPRPRRTCGPSQRHRRMPLINGLGIVAADDSDS
eukprot:scaffold5394_cov274-Prasinococcus_capsulatus_cf.AAC.1